MQLSIIIPIFNSEPYIESCIKSILKQRIHEMEVLLIDDGSTDQSSSICQFYTEEYDFIHYIRKENSGQGDTRNLGIQHAQGRFILFLDSDDELHEKALAHFLPFLNQDIDVVVSDIEKVTDSKRIYFKNYIDFKSSAAINLMLSHPGPVAKLIRRDLLIRNEIFFESGKIFEDLLFNVKLGLNAQSVHYLHAITYYYFIRKKSTMQSEHYEAKFNDIYDVMNTIDNLLIHHELESEFLHIEHLLYSASLRALRYPKTDERVKENVERVKKRFPNYIKNPYLKYKSIKFRFIVLLLNSQFFGIVRRLVKKRGG